MTRSPRAKTPPQREPKENDTDATVMTLSQISPSMLPELLAETSEELETLNKHLISQLYTSLCCPLCDSVLLNDPAAVETCGHVFCYDCINNAVERGYIPISNEEPPDNNAPHDTDDGVSISATSPNTSTRGNRKRPATRQEKPKRRQRRVQFTCPVCLGPAFKWTLVRVPLIQEVAAGAMRHPALAEILKRGKPQGVKCLVAHTNGAATPEMQSASRTPSKTPDATKSQSTGYDFTSRGKSNSEDLLTLGVPCRSMVSFVNEGEQHSVDIIPVPPQPSALKSAPINVNPQSETTTESIVNSNIIKDNEDDCEVVDVVNKEATKGNEHTKEEEEKEKEEEIKKAANGCSDSTQETVQVPCTTLTGSSFVEINALVGGNSQANLTTQNHHSPANSHGNKHNDGETRCTQERHVSLESMQTQDVLLGESNSDDNGVVRILQLTSTSCQVEPEMQQRERRDDSLSAPQHDSSLSDSSLLVQGIVPSFPLSFSIDRAVPDLATFNEALKSAKDLFGAVLTVDERFGKTITVHAPHLPFTVLRRPLHVKVTDTHSQPLHWCEVHYNHGPLASSHCLTDATNTADGLVVSVMTPSLATALVSGSAVVRWSWIPDSVTAGRLLPISSYTAVGTSYALWDPGAQTPGRWMSHGHAFLALPDILLHHLLGAEAPIATHTYIGGHKKNSWRRLVLLAGATWLQLAPRCLRVLIECAKRETCTEREAIRCALRAVMDDSAHATCTLDDKEDVVERGDLWCAECCPERAGSREVLRSVTVLRGPIPQGYEEEAERCTARLTTFLTALFALTKEESTRSVGTPSYVRFCMGRKKQEGHEKGCEDEKKYERTPKSEMEEVDNDGASLLVEARSTTWLLRNIAENRQSAGVRRRSHSRANWFTRPAPTEAAFQELLYEG